uniref:Uncharacterized protein n=1 Tax=Rhizophora mucronata TaxID=61149 RepID=A0A2P2R5F0_RHIMU
MTAVVSLVLAFQKSFILFFCNNLAFCFCLQL